MLTSPSIVLGKEMKCRSSTPSLITPNLQHSPATQPSHPNQLSLSAQYIAALGKTQTQEAFLFHLSLPCPSLFHFLIFLEAQLQGRRTCSLQLLLCQKSICPTVTVTACRVLTTENVECAWVPGGSAENCSCPELQRIWTTLPEEEQTIKVGVMLFLQAWPGTRHSLIPFPWTTLSWYVGNTQALEIFSWDAVIYGINWVAKNLSDWLLCKLGLNWNGDLNFSDCFFLNSEKHV